MPKLLETFDQLKMSSEIWSSDHFPTAILTFLKENQQLPRYNYNGKNNKNVNKHNFAILQLLAGSHFNVFIPFWSKTHIFQFSESHQKLKRKSSKLV